MKTYEFYLRNGTCHEITRSDDTTVETTAHAIVKDGFLHDALRAVRCLEIIWFRLIPEWELEKREKEGAAMKHTLADMRTQGAQEGPKNWWRVL